ncbi:glucose-6-phosphate 3-dehydrogenase NdtC [Bacillus sp. FSL R5-0560]|uniref:glucose-6-phosphate 3-dehydrogenase NdtC n=1 Tax=Bacillus sp. FSL R5-0560 TaxID=2954588 RepID=UPI0030D5B60B
MKKIGIIGAGGIAKAHATALSTIKNVELVGVYDINQQNAESFVKTFGGKTYENVDELIDVSEGLIVASPNFCHKEHALQALEKHKHVLCEKPMAISLEEASIMKDTAQRLGVRASMGFNYRYLSYVNILKSLIINNELGNILSIKVHFKKNSALRRKKFTWRDDANSKKTSGSLGDLGIHLIDMVWYLFESDFITESVMAKMNTNVKTKEDKQVLVDDYAEIYGQLKNKVFVNIITSKCSVPEDCGFSIEVVGHKKEFKYHTGNPHVYKLIDGLNVVDCPVPQSLLNDPPNEFYGWADSFRSELINWIASTQKDWVEIPSFNDGFRSQEVLEMFFEKDSNSQTMSVLAVN